MSRKFLYYSITALIIIRVFFISTAQAQGNFETLKSALIIRFVQHITWPNESEITVYNIGVMGTDTTTFNILKRSTTQTNIKGQNFKVRWIKSVDEIKGIHVLYVDESKSADLLEVTQAIENKKILLISELSEDTKNIMLNILHDDKKKRISFEVNKANIIIENLEMDPELLLLGGTEVDVRDLYKNIKKQFELERISVEEQKQFIKIQLEEINKQRNIITTNEQEIFSLKDNIGEFTEEVFNKEVELSKLSENIQKQQESLKRQEEQLQEQIRLSQNREDQLLNQNHLIKIRSQELDSLSRESEKQKATISFQTSSLESKEEIIGLQKRVIIIVICFVLIFGFLSIVIYRVYRSRQMLSSKLENSYATLREQHTSILQLNEELNAINEMLEDKVQERTKILEERNTQLTEYAFINSHLLRAPLSQILGLSNLLTHENLKVEDRTIVDSLAKSTAELDRIIRKISDLLYDGKDFSREEIEGIISRKFNPTDKLSEN